VAGLTAEGQGELHRVEGAAPKNKNIGFAM